MYKRQIIRLSVFRGKHNPHDRQIGLITGYQRIVTDMKPIDDHTRCRQIDICFSLGGIIGISHVIDEPAVQVQHGTRQYLQVFCQPELVMQCIIPIDHTCHFITCFCFILCQGQIGLEQTLNRHVAIHQFGRCV